MTNLQNQLPSALTSVFREKPNWFWANNHVCMLGFFTELATRKKYSDPLNTGQLIPRQSGVPRIRKFLWLVSKMVGIRNPNIQIWHYSVLYFYSDKLSNQQVVTNCTFFFAQSCTGKNTCPPKWKTLFDNIRSQSELTTTEIHNEQNFVSQTKY